MIVVWLKVNSTSTILHKSTVHWGTLFLFAIWSLWKNRNKVVFENYIPNPNLHKVCIHQGREYFYCVSKTFQAARKVAIQVRWNKPPEGWFKLNTDGASHGNCCEILKYSQVYEPYRSIVGQERGRTHRDLYECRKIN